ncbi:MAG: hypothetical protein K9M84_00820 [Spirochaetia bacterium]|nr:hypothetical protein [Spirochaetia bacterium]
MKYVSRLQQTPPILMIGSTAKKLGKTSLICSALEGLKTEHRVSVIKITPLDVMEAPFTITLSTRCNPEGTTDTDRFIAAGAAQAYWIRSSHMQLDEALALVLRRIPSDHLCIIESSSAYELLEPNLFIMLRGNEDEIKRSAEYALSHADVILDRGQHAVDQLQITFDGTSYQYSGL